MKMVVASADLQGIHLMLACDSADIGPDTGFKIRFDPRDAIFRAEDYVIVRDVYVLAIVRVLQPGDFNRRYLTRIYFTGYRP